MRFRGRKQTELHHTDGELALEIMRAEPNDPDLLDLFLANIESFVEIRDTLKDIHEERVGVCEIDTLS